MHPALFRHRFHGPQGAARDGEVQRDGHGKPSLVATRRDPGHLPRYANHMFPTPPETKTSTSPPADSDTTATIALPFKFLRQPTATGVTENKSGSGQALSPTSSKTVLPTESLTPPLSPSAAAGNVVSIGDVLMLSQVAWRISRHFSPRHNPGACLPPEFVMIEDELANFSKSLKQLGESLVSEGVESFIHSADQKVQDNIGTILRSCHRILEDLESLTFSYQERLKVQSSRGVQFQRNWRPTVLADYQYVIWTANGGTIRNLEEMLHIHTVVVTMLKTILEGMVPVELEIGVPYVASKIAELDQCHPEDVSSYLAEVRGYVHAAGYEGPSPKQHMPPTPPYARSSSGSLATQAASTPSTPIIRTDSEPVPVIPKTELPSLPPQSLPPQSLPPQSQPPPTTPLPSIPPSGNPYKAPMSRKKPPPPNIYVAFPSTGRTKSEPGSPKQAQRAATSPPELGDAALASVSTVRAPSNPIPNAALEAPPKTALRRSLSMPDSNRPVTSPSPSKKVSPKEERPKEPPKSFGLSSWNVPAGVTAPDEKPIPAEMMAAIEHGSVPQLHRKSSSWSQQDNFEKSHFRNAVILCNVRGTLVDYTVPQAEQVDYDMEEVMKSCRICIVRHKKVYLGGRVTYCTNIWAFSDDLSVRFEQNLDENTEIIPYTSFFTTKKVSITFPTKVTHHDVIPGSAPLKTCETNWVNYHFEDEEGSRQFQNQLFGRRLVASFKTEKTLRIHDGLGGIMGIRDQMCGLENLRVWEEEETGGVLALIHYSGLFCSGYMKFYLNDARYPLVLKDDVGSRVLRLKGMRTPFQTRDMMIKGQSKLVTSAKIEFAREFDKNEFIRLVREAQLGMVEIEDRHR